MIVDAPLLDPAGRWMPRRRVALATIACGLLLDRDSGQAGVPLASIENWLNVGGDAARQLVDVAGVWVDGGVCGFVPSVPLAPTMARSTPVLMRVAQILNRNSHADPVVADALLAAACSTPKVVAPVQLIELRLSDRWARWRLPDDPRTVLARIGVGYGMQLTEWHPIARIEDRLRS